jgi:hypothetical protein
MTVRKLTPDNAEKRRNSLNLNWKEPPCAGITLIRFYGYDLSLPPIDGKHPGKH